ncbi:bifunctional DNA primase/polymerase [Micromonospora aurantiaca]|uniref:bifunctional DNA primase/polymerase n=1 Tax=Micromonospora aurantiaca (nom. illeg.) TaxID=47850 RepID=UPI0008293E32|nr:bifunctional DNA primase/polymerase [Micromonospora aurantiaca]SCL43712.1 Bifunctional DNA primase/polymerase, N-terminal [Micromonospora aurantiaca]
MRTDPTLALAAGLAVFPLPAGAKRAAPGWPHQITTDPAAIAAWPAGINVGVACRASNVVGLDLDRKDGVDGVDTLRALCAAARWPWPATLTVATAHNGLHLYFRAPAGVIVPSTIGRWPGVDVRAPGRRLGGYLVGPGSVVDGRPYTVTRDLPIAELPPWLTKKLTNGRHRAGVTAAAPA